MQKFETLNEMRNHHLHHHFQPPRYMCPHCYKIYLQYHGFVSHLKKFQCNVDFHCEHCPKIFPNKKLLDLHRRIHVENPPFQCSICHKSFKQPSGLYAHSRCHLPENLKKEFACDQCDKWLIMFIATIPTESNNSSTRESIAYFIFVLSLVFQRNLI